MTNEPNRINQKINLIISKHGYNDMKSVRKLNYKKKLRTIWDQSKTEVINMKTQIMARN